MSVADMCKAIVELSDNTCANALLARVGGPGALTEFWRRAGDTVSRLDHNEPELNRSPPGDIHDTTTPAAMAGNLLPLFARRRCCRRPRANNSRNGWSTARPATTGCAAACPADWKIGDKTGNNGKDASGDIAIAWPKSGGPVLVAAYTQGGSPTPQQLEAVFKEIGAMVGVS